jgi:hypothetical protein
MSDTVWIGISTGLLAFAVLSFYNIVSDGFYNICTQIKYSREEILRELKSIDDHVKGSSKDISNINDRLKTISVHLGAEMSAAESEKMLRKLGIKK